MNAYESTLSAAEWSICKLLSVTFVDHVKYADIPTGPPPPKGASNATGYDKMPIFLQIYRCKHRILFPSIQHLA